MYPIHNNYIITYQLLLFSLAGPMGTGYIDSTCPSVRPSHLVFVLYFPKTVQVSCIFFILMAYFNLHQH